MNRRRAALLLAAGLVFVLSEYAKPAGPDPFQWLAGPEPAAVSSDAAASDTSLYIPAFAPDAPERPGTGAPYAQADAEPPAPEPPVNPLTGEAAEPGLERRRPVAVVFNNIRRAQPQLGISQADVIYEVPAEGGITRMVGLFQSLDGVGTLGSIRSVRPYMLELVLSHDALLVHAGGSPDAYREIPAWGVDNLDGVRGGTDALIFWRDEARRAAMGFEHSLLTSGENVAAYLARGRYRTEHPAGYRLPWNFAADGTPRRGTAAVHAEVRFSDYKTGVFDYDPESGSYLASQYGGPYTDGSTGAQVRAVNVLVLETEVTAIIGDEAGRLEVAVTGEGAGTFLCGGRALPIRWSRTDRNSPYVFTKESGLPLTLGRGVTYICITPPGSLTTSGEAG